MHIQSRTVGPSSHRHRLGCDISIAMAVMILIAACSSGVPDQPLAAGDQQTTAVASPSPPPSSPSAESDAAPRTGSGFFAGSANVPVAFTVPPGWETVNNSFVLKSGADPAFAVGFYDVANIYADGCRWEQVDPPVGPTVDDLVEAYESVADLAVTPARAITVDGFEGKQLAFTVPAHDPDSCQDATFALVSADNAGSNTVQDGAPNLWALTPNQENQVLILDVDGTRLVVFVVHPPDVSAVDRAAMDSILDSVQIG